MVTITIVKELEQFLGDDEDLSGMSDEELVEFCQEDIPALLDGAVWMVGRGE